MKTVEMATEMYHRVLIKPTTSNNHWAWFRDKGSCWWMVMVDRQDTLHSLHQKLIFQWHKTNISRGNVFHRVANCYKSEIFQPSCGNPLYTAGRTTDSAGHTQQSPGTFHRDLPSESGSPGESLGAGSRRERAEFDVWFNPTDITFISIKIHQNPSSYPSKSIKLSWALKRIHEAQKILVIT